MATTITENEPQNTKACTSKTTTAFDDSEMVKLQITKEELRFPLGIDSNSEIKFIYDETGISGIYRRFFRLFLFNGKIRNYISFLEKKFMIEQLSEREKIKVMYLVNWCNAYFEMSGAVSEYPKKNKK